MKVYISGISGTGMGPLALFAANAGIEVVGSDLAKGAIYDELMRAGIRVKIGVQDGEFLKSEIDGLNLFVYTSALPENHPELMAAREAGVKISKRDDFTAYLVDKLGLKMVAVAGTHGKTTTTAMTIWACLKLGLPVSYVVGTTLGFTVSGAYHDGDKYFVYEADEYDRNFLKYHPWLAVIPSVSYDHPDIYPTVSDYEAAFLQFKSQSEMVIENTADGIVGGEVMFLPEDFKLAGGARRIDAAMAANAVMRMLRLEHNDGLVTDDKKMEVTRILNEFPGVGRRFEKLADGLYTDYAHHPEEIVATIEMAREQAKIDDKKGVVVVYEPHQNARQTEVKDGYREAFVGADKIFWLPTYLVREPEGVPILSAEELAGGLVNEEDVCLAWLSRGLAITIREELAAGNLVLLMTAGPADAWMRRLAAGESVDELAH